MLASSAVDHSFGIGMMCPSGVYSQTVVSVEAIGIGLLCLVSLSAKFQVTVILDFLFFYSITKENSLLIV
jgi:hypothetical protein